MSHSVDLLGQLQGLQLFAEGILDEAIQFMTSVFHAPVVPCMGHSKLRRPGSGPDESPSARP